MREHNHIRECRDHTSTTSNHLSINQNIPASTLLSTTSFLHPTKIFKAICSSSTDLQHNEINYPQNQPSSSKMKFATILSFAAAATFQLISANVHSSCWCEISGEMNSTITAKACKAYPTEAVFDSNEKKLEDPSIVAIRVSNITMECTSFNKESRNETPYLGGKEFSTACSESAPEDADVESKCDSVEVVLQGVAYVKHA